MKVISGPGRQLILMTNVGDPCYHWRLAAAAAFELEKCRAQYLTRSSSRTHVQARDIRRAMQRALSQTKSAISSIIRELRASIDHPSPAHHLADLEGIRSNLLNFKFKMPSLK